jgi:hypothetical protein
MVNVRQAQLFQRCHTGWLVFDTMRGGTRLGSIFQTRGTRIAALFPGCRPAGVVTTGLQVNHIKLNSWSQQALPLPTPMPVATNLQERLHNLPPEAGWMVEEVKQFQDCKDDGRDVAKALREGKCRAVTDGTHKDNEGEAGFVVQSNQSRHQLLGYNRTPGMEEEMTRCQAEIGDAIRVLTLVAEICVHHGVTE